ncbi:unnamed protein product [Rotaria socialis]
MDEIPTTYTFDLGAVAHTIHSNHRIRQIVQQAVNEFLVLQNELLQHLEKEALDKTTEVKSKLLMDILKIQSLNKQVIADKVQLALVGENSCGKTSLIHYILESDPFLPSDVGSVSARIILLTYADNADACLRIYSSLEKRHQESPEQISLSEYFSEPEPDWDGVKDRIAVHVKRPKNLQKHSEEFALWAKSFVEIRIPSNFLKLGIDLYDTPGLIYSDPPVLNENLHTLVKTVIPTVVFMYENSAVIVDTKDCFLALKEALGKQLDDTSIFFLNTKVDIGTIVNTGTSINGEEFEKTTLVNARQKRKDLLLKAPGMAQQMFHNSEFDIISAESQWDSRGIKMNQLAIDHLIQFVANSDLKIAKEVSKLVLPIINSFFDYAFVTSHRTREQLKELRRNANQWTENYFIDRQKNLDQVLRILYNIIVDKLNDETNSIIQRAAQQNSVEMIGKYIRTLMQHEIIQLNVREFIHKNAAISTIETLIRSSLFKNADKNEFLVTVHEKLFSSRLEKPGQPSGESYDVTPVVRPLLMVADILVESDEEDNQNNTKRTSPWKELKKQFRQNVIRKTRPSKSMEKLDIAQQYLNDIRLGFMNQKNHINEFLVQWCENERTEFLEEINEQHQLAIRFLPQRVKAYNLTNKYAERFAHIECKLIVAQSLALFNGHTPALKQVLIHEDHFFQLHPAEWAHEKDLIVKKFKEVSDLQYLEAHYYQKISQLSVSGLLSLLYLYLNDDDELWMFFPRYEHLDSNIDSLTVKDILKMLLTIAQCLQKLHANELIHGNIDKKNIYMAPDGKYILGDLYSKTKYETLLDCVKRHETNNSSREFADDIYSLGEVGTNLYESLKRSDQTSEVLDQLKSLLEKCLYQDPLLRPNASKTLETLSSLLEQA